MRYKAEQYLLGFLQGVKHEVMGESGTRQDEHCKAYRAFLRSTGAEARSERIRSRVEALARRWDRQAEFVSLEVEQCVREFWDTRLKAAVERTCGGSTVGGVL